MAVHLSIFINGCLSDSDEWYETVEAAEAAITAPQHYEYNRYATITSAYDGATCHKYELFELDWNGGPRKRSAYMAEITEYPNLEFCSCERDALDNETGLYDPSIADCCMACERDQNAMHDAWEAQNEPTARPAVWACPANCMECFDGYYECADGQPLG
jgi:hypothetical protein